MARKQVMVRPGSAVYRRPRQPVIRRRINEVAGEAAAECAAVTCCCPATAVNLVVLAVYKVPAGICRKALKGHRRRRLMRKGLFPLHSAAYSEAADEEELTVVVVEGSEVDKELTEFENEMWEKFDGGGFWRSPSHIEDKHEVLDNRIHIIYYS